MIKSHDKKLTNTSVKYTLPCNCRKKYSPLDGVTELKILFINALLQ